MTTPTVASRGARARARLFATAAIAVVGAAGGCTTSLGNGALGGYDKSTLIALSDPVMGMTVAGNTVYWIDDTGSVWSCDAVSCGNAPKRLHASTGTVSSAVQLGVSGDWLFWVIGASLFGCPTSGCPAGTLTALAMSNQQGGTGGTPPAFAIDTAGGTGAYWVGQTNLGASGGQGQAVLRYTPDCASGCPETVFAPNNNGNVPTMACGPSCTTCPMCVSCTADTDCPAGQFCTNYPGGPTPAACSPQLVPGSSCGQGSTGLSSPLACAFGSCENDSCPAAQPAIGAGIAIAGGNVYFVATSSQTSILSCPVAGCSLSTLSTYWTGSDAMGGQATLFGASASALYFSDSQGMSDDLESCSLPTCGGTPMSVGTNISAVLAFSPTDFYVLSDYGPSTATACPLSGCPSAPSTVTPDPGLDSTPIGVAPNACPFALDGTAIVWATSNVFGQPGNQIVRTPAP
jgi:Cys-rich repeat protein